MNAAELRVIAAGGGETPQHEPVPWRLHRAEPDRCSRSARMYFGAIYGWYFYITWLPTYLLRARGFDLSQVGWLAALPLLAIAAGVFRAAGRATACGRLGRAARPAHPGLVGFPLAALAVAVAALDAEPWRSALLLARRRRAARRSASRRPGRSASRSAARTPGW